VSHHEPPGPDEQFIAFIDEALRVFGRGARLKLRVAGGECVLIFPADPNSTPAAGVTAATVPSREGTVASTAGAVHSNKQHPNRQESQSCLF
jgi:hypothetical protein